MSKQRMGFMELGYGARVMLPLAEAHKIQAILAEHAVGIERAHTKDYTAVMYLADYKVPDVAVIPDDIPYDARGLTSKQINRWSEMLKQAEPNTEVVDPHTFATIYGEEDETNS